MRNYFVTLLLIIFCVKAEDNTLYILHTNNTNGALENCYCPDHPFGAIEKRSVFINDFIEKHPNTIVVDAGDFFPVTKRPFLDSLIVEAYNSLPYDAVLAGDQELSRNNLSHFAKKLKYPFLAANLNNHNELSLDSHVILSKGNYNIGIIGTVHPSVFRFYPKEIKETLKFEDPEEIIRDFIYDFSDSLDLILALSHQGHDKDVQMAEAVSGLNVIIGSHSQTKLDKGENINDCLIVQAGKEGYYVGVVEINFNDEMEIISSSSRIETMTLEMEDDPYIMKLIDALEKETGHINRNKLKHLKSE
ncbi:MAG: hypothetical protein QGF69_02670 [Candidatus Marinimicrobia bacterium]|jgi:5'-nucleotidase|nr:hypothetical protein [Candidatus Neomarinimicrobiota bacterium]MDP7566075.1 hypothetical protein [Candidatus Neomarinimicrobiota bacterium]HJL74179.1 hypothetical protein [Candidatus Neomarinimicrobiota bacterium]|tara:strand:+ start:1662 stop:2573 length:912 start_codon:yes stop_codon:yes gene_type:complete